MSELSPTDSPTLIVARAGRYYRNARYLIVAMALGAGLWFGYDGFYNWPRQREIFDHLTADEKSKVHAPQNDKSILVNQLLGVVLVPIAPLLLGFFLYRSRGEYRLDGTTLYVPGHPPVPAESITAIDKTLWTRKGIAYIEYQLPGAGGGDRLTLDDFVYDQEPTDKIVAWLETFISPADPESVDAESEPIVSPEVGERMAGE